MLRRAVLSPKRQKGLWDAVLSHFEIDAWGEIIEFLRAESLRLGVDGLRRKISGPAEIDDIVGRLLAEAAETEWRAISPPG